MPSKAADPLATYNAKRDFAKTAEPAGKIAPGEGNRPSTGSGGAFIVQKHDATRLHWDLRLEVDGVLKSWAVTRGPSLNPDDKRLAVRTEDHPMSYADFEGIIPAKEYGGGTVMLWDVGTWTPIAGKSAKDLDKGHLHFTLDGARMKGEWLLVRIKGRPGEKRENWLLRKIEDGEAGGSDTLVETGLTSVKTGRTMREIAENKILPGAGRVTSGRLVEGVRRKTSPRGGPPPPSASGGRSPSPSRGGFPAFAPPQLATLVDAVPTGSDWLHEVKYDGYRAIVSIGGGKAKVFTRSGLDWTDKFPAIAEAAAALDVGSALIDGEITALDKDGRPDFSSLQAAIKGGGEMVMFAFDLLSLEGEDLRALPNVQRKERLRPLIPASGAIQFAEHIVGSGEQLFETMCGAGYEGIVSKRADAPYRGARTKAWLKVKCTRRQEFVVVGWIESSAKGRGFASLLLGLNDTDGLRYAGKVGTGFDGDTIDDLRTRLDGLARKTAAVEVPREAARKAHWVKPELVAEVAFAEFTADNVIRHASFIGLRGDKAAKDVAPEPVGKAPAPAPAVRISNPDRVIFPEDGLTKGDLAAYYGEVTSLMLPWTANRPASLVRCPQGRGKACFFQKHDAGSFGDAVKKVAIAEKKGGTEDYLYVDSAAGLLQCVQMGTIEFHGWASSIATLERPDRMVLDLDPDEGLGFDIVVKAAEKLKSVLGDLGLTSFPMLSGGKGVHVVVPLSPQADWATFTGFADRFAHAMAADDPDRFVATMSKAKRKGRIFIDWLRNQRGSTAILPYSARARPGAPVAVPISWAELKDIEAANLFSIRDAATLIERAQDRSLRGWGVSDQVLPDL